MRWGGTSRQQVAVGCSALRVTLILLGFACGGLKVRHTLTQSKKCHSEWNEEIFFANEEILFANCTIAISLL